MQDTVVSQRIKDAFVFLAVSDTKFLQAARQSIKPEYLGSEVLTNLVSICYRFFDQFGVAPQNHFPDEAAEFLQGKEPDKVELYLTYLERLKTMDPPNVPYVISRINSFVQTRELEKGLVLVAQLAKEGKMDEVRNQMQGMLRVGIQKEEVGLRYFNSNLPTYLQPHRSNERLMGVGLAPIDSHLIRGLCRTDFACILGGYKGKKSWACVWFGLQGLLHGLKVLHVSHELSLEDTEMRYDMAAGGLGSSLIVPTENVEIEETDANGDFVRTEIIERPTISDLGAVRTTRRRLVRCGGDLIIRKYPMGSCSMDELRRYLDYLECFEGFVPDIVINDYIEKMKVPGGPKRNDAINDMYMDCKGIADDRKLLMLTVSQATREALRKNKLDQKDFAEDIRKLGNVDLVFAISQSDREAVLGRMLFWVLANRNGPMDFGCKFNQNLKIGQFAINSWPYKPKNNG